MNSKIIINTLVSGIISGSLYAMMTVGLTMIYGVVKLFNFGHGLVAVLGGYLAWLLLVQMGLPVVISIILASVAMFFFGWALFRTTLAPLIKRPDWENLSIFFLIGIGMIMENGMLQIFGPRIKNLPRFIDGRIKLGLLRVNTHDLLLIVVVLVIFILIGLYLKKTWTGRCMQAVAQQMDGARVVGINVNRTFALAFALGTAVTAFSGILLATKYSLTPTAGWSWMFRGFVVVALGGLGSVSGSIVAAYILGVAEAFITLYLNTTWVYPAWFIIFVIILVTRPQGIMGGRAD